MNEHERPEGRPSRSVGTHNKGTPEIGTVARLADPETFAAEVIEKCGPDEARRRAAWILLMAEEVGK